MTKEKFRLCSHDILTGALMLAVGLHVVAICLLAAVPPVSRDALTHHLLIPRLYFQHGGIVELPHIHASYYPQLLELLYCIPMFFNNDIIPKYIHFMFALGTALLIYSYLKNTLSRAYGWLGAFFFLTLPIIVKLSISVYVDLGLIFFTTAVLYLLLYKWPQRGFAWRHLVLAGIAAGLAAGTKYNGFIVVLLASLLIPFLLTGEQKRPKKAIVCLLCFWSMAIAIFSPWMIRNYLWTGNPVYPLAQKVFSHPSEQANTSQPKKGATDNIFTRATPFWVRKTIYKENILEILSIPARIFFQGKDDAPKYFDGVLSPFLLLLPFFAFQHRTRQERRVLSLWAAFSAGLILIVFFTSDMRIRYISPAIPGVVILSVFGLDNLRRHVLPGVLRSNRKQTAFFSLILLLLFSFNISYMIRQFDHVKPLSYLSGKITRDQYIERHRPEYPLVQYLNHITGKNDMVMAIYLGRRQYYFDGDVRFAENLLLKYAQSAANVADLDAKIRGAGFTYIILRYDLFNILLEHRVSSEERALIEGFFAQDTVALKSANGYGAYRIIDPATTDNDR